jgi:hypothetical protein
MPGTANVCHTTLAMGQESKEYCSMFSTLKILLKSKNETTQI